MHITQKHIVDCLHEKTYNNDHYHGLSVQELKRLPEALESPVILAESLTKEDSLVAVLDYREQDGNPVIVAVRLNGNAIYELRRVDSNFITSAYGKDNFSEFYQRILDQREENCFMQIGKRGKSWDIIWKIRNLRCQNMTKF